MAKRRKDDRNKKILIVVFMSIFMVSSIASIVMFYGNDNNSDSNKLTLTYNGKDYVFERKVDSLGYQSYDVSSGDRKFTVFYLPDQLSYIDADNYTKEKIMNSQTYYMVFDPEDPEAGFIDYLRFELKRTFPTTKYFFEGITNSSETYQLPVAGCMNATEYVPVIILESGNQTSISGSDNCIHVDFAPYDSARIHDFMIYLLEGINV